MRGLGSPVLAWVLALCFGLPAAAAEVPPTSGPEGFYLNGGPKLEPSGISRKTLEREMERAQRSGKPADRQSVLEALVRRELLYQAGREAGVRVEPAAVEREVAGFKAKFTSPAAFARELAALGLSEAELREEVRRGMVIQSFVQQRFDAEFNPSPEELRAWYQAHQEHYRLPARVRASQILVRTAPDWEAERRERAREKIEMIREQLREGKDFGALARQFSECYSAQQGGDLGFFRFEEMQEPFAQAAFALQPGQTSEIVETAQGYHLIRVAAVEPAGLIPFERAEEDVTRRLRAEQARQAMMRYADLLRGETPAEIFLRGN